MVTRRFLLGPLLLLLAGCPDDVGEGLQGPTGLLAPANLSGTPNGGSQIRLRWSDKASTETGYRLDMNFAPFTTPVIAGSRILPSNATSFVYPTFPNTTYHFRLVAITPTMESDPAVIVVTTPDVPVQPVVAASTQSSTEIRISWPDLPDETGYRLERSPDGGATWSLIRSLAAGSTSVVDGGLPSDTEYGYRLIAFGVNGDSTPSEPAFALTATNAMVFDDPLPAGDAGRWISYTVAPDGSDHLSHYDVANTNVLYTSRSPSAAYVTATVDAGPTGVQDVGGDGTSLAIDGEGKVHVASHDLTKNELRYSTNASGPWKASTIDSGPGPSGVRLRLLWSPVDARLHLLYLAFRPSPSLPEIQLLAKSPGAAWEFVGIIPIGIDPAASLDAAVDDAGGLHTSFVDQFGVLWYHGPFAAATSNFQLLPVPDPAARADRVSVAIDGSGAVHVAWHDRTSRSLYHTTNASGTWRLSTIDQAAGLDLGSHCSMAVHRPSGRLHVAYHDATNGDLRYARKDPGGAWVRRVLDVTGDVGSHAALAVDSGGQVRVAYRDETLRRLKIARGTP